jgi:hypothetical protein
MEKLVLLASFFNATDAHLLKGLLESEGMESFVFDERSSSVTPLIGGVRLMVWETDLERAKEIMSRPG